VQLLQLQRAVAGSSGTVRKNRMTWSGRIQPSPASITYTVQIVALHGQAPDITVLDPPLEKREGEALPHTFPGDRLCVYRNDEWNPSKPMATTLLPWISEWLVYYELWLPTGEWFGGGHEFRGDRKRTPAANGRSAASARVRVSTDARH